MTTPKIMSISSRSPSKCDKNRKTCPPGHYMNECADNEGYECLQCSVDTFQPNPNRLGDKCRVMRSCGDPYKEYASYGDTVTDAHCKCMKGFHFENEDQRACVPNRECGKGYGQATYGYELGDSGVCESCLEKQMYSDVKDRFQQCKPLRNCEKENRCVAKKSNGTFDNVCGPLVRDINDCSSVVEKVDDDVSNKYLSAIIGSVVGVFVIVFIFIIILLARRRRAQRRKNAQKPLTSEQLEELKHKLLDKCEKDESLCKKTLSTAFRVTEDRIDRQIWNLPQELFRSQPGRYEILVKKYTESHEKYAVNGYLRDWKEWRGSTHESVKELFYCLRQCKRDDITYEVCNQLRDEVDITFDVEANIDDMGGNNRAKDSLMYDIRDILFPCAKPSEKKGSLGKSEQAETTHKLLEISQSAPDMDPKAAGAIYREHPLPSAPEYVDDNNTIIEPNIVDYKRQFSCPVQCTT
ncbi:uncharacterized protein LOC126827483 isoform X3 [Patella vulgata]|uniref:uncharacterized protein LOC126827483 isoform X3 n=1 Tax=Patella vulgata TaxID=6465 RepID=UPI00217FBE3A|nr:uncharacterized protein LOC126827483 isoform X3 [Patella vulgata]XP_050412823.1 uncharacterized protein LOC126827483 isoform X3 [Patella vulgata]XP_055958209.1 uncharacterized protein LOC126827483 isoform X3 [Patella vulgata]